VHDALDDAAGDLPTDDESDVPSLPASGIPLIGARSFDEAIRDVGDGKGAALHQLPCDSKGAPPHGNPPQPRLEEHHEKSLRRLLLEMPDAAVSAAKRTARARACLTIFKEDPGLIDALVRSGHGQLVDVLDLVNRLQPQRSRDNVALFVYKEVVEAITNRAQEALDEAEMGRLQRIVYDGLGQMRQCNGLPERTKKVLLRAYVGADSLTAFARNSRKFGLAAASFCALGMGGPNKYNYAYVHAFDKNLKRVEREAGWMSSHQCRGLRRRAVRHPAVLRRARGSRTLSRCSSA
jgi:hypothetical protein